MPLETALPGIPTAQNFVVSGRRRPRSMQLFYELYPRDERDPVFACGVIAKVGQTAPSVALCASADNYEGSIPTNESRR